MRHCGWLLGLLSLFSLATHASDWQEIKNEAKGQTVWFNAWGGDTAINRYLDWVSGEMKTHYAINLKIVRLADAADAVKRIQTEAAAGRKTGGSVDLLWVNGENFRTLKEANLLQTGWAETLPNWRLSPAAMLRHSHHKRRKPYWSLLKPIPARLPIRAHRTLPARRFLNSC